MLELNGNELVIRFILHVRNWEQFKVLYDKMELPTGQVVGPQQIFAEIALLGIQSELEIKTSTHLLGLARAIANIKK